MKNVSFSNNMFLLEDESFLSDVVFRSRKHFILAEKNWNCALEPLAPSTQQMS